MKMAPLKVLSEEEILIIHKASLDVLEHTGIAVDYPEALDLLEKNGAKVDRASKRAWLPPELVERCVESVPETFDLFDRDGKKAMTIGDGVPHCAAGHNAVFFIDHTTSERRICTLQDIADFAVLCEALPTIDIVGVPLVPQDVNAQFSLVYAVKALFENTRKPLFFSTESSAVNRAIVDLMKINANGKSLSERPNAVCQLSPTSPLFWEHGAVQALIEVVEDGVPVNILPEPMSGVSAPYSVAGLLTLHNAETLSGLVIGQCAKKGAPMLYGSSWTTYDMKFSAAIIASPETHILRVAGCQMARYYKVPCHTTAPNSDSNLHDEQNAWERSISNMCSLLAGNDIVMNSGMFATGLTVSHEQLVMDDEMNGIIRRVARGIDVSEATIGVKAVNDVGPRGDYLVHDHTLGFLYSDEFRHNILVRSDAYDNWRKKGAPDVATLAAGRVNEILGKGPVCPLPKETLDAMEKVLAPFKG